MAIFEETEEEKEEDEEEAKRRLFDIHSEELSFVDRAANKKKYLFFKNEESLMKDEQTEVDGRNLTSEDLDTGFGVDSGHEDLVSDSEAAIQKSWDLVEEVKDGFPDLFDEEKAGHLDEKEEEEDEDDKARDMDEEEEEEDREKVEFTISEPVRTAMLRMLTQASERTSNLLQSVKNAKITNEKLDKPVPVQAGRMINRIVDGLEGVLRQYPSPMAKINIPGPVQRQAVKKLTEVLETVTTALQAVQDAEVMKDKKDKPLPGDIGRMIKKAMTQLDLILNRYPSTSGKYEGLFEKEIESVETEKAGRKISTKNLGRFKKIQDLVSELLKDLDNENEGENENEGTEEGMSQADEFGNELLTAFSKQCEELTECVKEVSATVKKQGKVLDKISGEPEAPNSRPIEKANKNTKVYWPNDMNRPLDRKHVPENKYMG